MGGCCHTAKAASERAQLTNLGLNAFKLCTAVTNTVTIPANVQELAASALSFAGKLVGNAAVMPLSGDIKIPGSLKKIGPGGLNNGWYASIDFSAATNLVELGDRSFAWEPAFKSTIVEVPCTDLDLGGCTSLTNFGSNVFKRFGQVRSLVFPDSVKTIGTDTFHERNTMLTNLVLSASLENLATYPFGKWRAKRDRGVSHVYFRNCPTTIVGALFTVDDSDSIVCHLPRNGGHMEEWKAYVANNPNAGLVLPSDDNSVLGHWRSGGDSDAKRAVVSWYQARYPGRNGLALVFR